MFSGGSIPLRRALVLTINGSQLDRYGRLPILKDIFLPWTQVSQYLYGAFTYKLVCIRAPPSHMSPMHVLVHRFPPVYLSIMVSPSQYLIMLKKIQYHLLNMRIITHHHHSQSMTSILLVIPPSIYQVDILPQNIIIYCFSGGSPSKVIHEWITCW